MAASTNIFDLRFARGDPGSGSELPDLSSQAPARPHWTSFTRAHVILYFIAPMVALMALTVGVRCCDLDLRTCRLFFNVEVSQFSAVRAEPWLSLYRYGPIPGLVLGIGSTVVFVGSFVLPRLRPFREPCALMSLLLALGPGLLVNGILKPSWDRPRPCELFEFGGDEAFVPILNLSTIGEHVSKSFPSGHASIGFYLLAPIFVLPQRSRRWSIAFLVLGLSLGFAMGLGRVAQGRHFPSDILWAGAIVYFSGLCLAYVSHLAGSATWSQTFEGRGRGEEPAVFRIEEYRHEARPEIDTTQSSGRDVSERRVA